MGESILGNGVSEQKTQISGVQEVIDLDGIEGNGEIQKISEEATNNFIQSIKVKINNLLGENNTEKYFVNVLDDFGFDSKADIEIFERDCKGEHINIIYKLTKEGTQKIRNVIIYLYIKDELSIQLGKSYNIKRLKGFIGYYNDNRKSTDSQINIDSFEELGINLNEKNGDPVYSNNEAFGNIYTEYSCRQKGYNEFNTKQNALQELQTKLKPTYFQTYFQNGIPHTYNNIFTDIFQQATEKAADMTSISTYEENISNKLLIENREKLRLKKEQEKSLEERNQASQNATKEFDKNNDQVKNNQNTIKRKNRFALLVVAALAGELGLGLYVNNKNSYDDIPKLNPNNSIIVPDLGIINSTSDILSDEARENIHNQVKYAMKTYVEKWLKNGGSQHGINIEYRADTKHIFDLFKLLGLKNFYINVNPLKTSIELTLFGNHSEVILKNEIDLYGKDTLMNQEESDKYIEKRWDKLEENFHILLVSEKYHGNKGQLFQIMKEAERFTMVLHFFDINRTIYDNSYIYTTAINDGIIIEIRPKDKKYASLKRKFLIPEGNNFSEEYNKINDTIQKSVSRISLGSKKIDAEKIEYINNTIVVALSKIGIINAHLNFITSKPMNHPYEYLSVSYNNEKYLLKIHNKNLSHRGM